MIVEFNSTEAVGISTILGLIAIGDYSEPPYDILLYNYKTS